MIAVAVLAVGCFPESARHRRYAKFGEAGAIVSGVALQLINNSRNSGCADRTPGTRVSCDEANIDIIGLALIGAGLVGFAATMITTPSDPADEPQPSSPRWAVPESFCMSLALKDVLQAEAALTTYLKSVGAQTAIEASDALLAWLPRQHCVVVEETDDLRGEQIVLRAFGKSSIPCRIEISVQRTMPVASLKSWATFCSAVSFTPALGSAL